MVTLDKNFVTLENFGHSLRAPAYVLSPLDLKRSFRHLKLANKTGLTVTARGAGRSYNDASLNGGGIVLDMSAMNRIVKWDPLTGRVTGRAGRHDRETLAMRRTRWLVAASCFRHNVYNIGGLPRRKHSWQK